MSDSTSWLLYEEPDESSVGKPPRGSAWDPGEWGVSPWGSSSADSDLVPTAGVEAVNVLADDLLEVRFTTPMRNTDALRNAGIYTIEPIGDYRSVEVLSVNAGREFATDVVYLTVTAPEKGAYYIVSVTGALTDVSNQTLEVTEARILPRRTKIDSLVSSRPAMYDTRPQAVYRNLLNAIGRSDDQIGGSQDEGWEIVR